MGLGWAKRIRIDNRKGWYDGMFGLGTDESLRRSPSGMALSLYAQHFLDGAGSGTSRKAELHNITNRKEAPKLLLEAVLEANSFACLKLSHSRTMLRQRKLGALSRAPLGHTQR